MREFGFKLNKQLDGTVNMEYVVGAPDLYHEGEVKGVTEMTMNEMIGNYEASGYKITYCKE